MTLNEAKTLLENEGYKLLEKNALELEGGFNAWCMELERILQDRNDFTDSEISYFSRDFEKYFEQGLDLDQTANILVRRKYRELDESVSNLDEHKNRHPLRSEYFVEYFRKLLDRWGFTKRKKNTDPEPMTYLYTDDQNVSMFEISEKGEYDDEIIVNVLSSSIATDGAVYTIVADDISYNGDNIEEFKEDLDLVFGIR
jgi:hypothetical protein